MILADSPAIEQNEILNLDKDRYRIRKRGGSTSKEPSPSRWRNSNQNRVYSAKLFDAVRRVRRTDSPVKPRGRSIREAADRALAVTDGGRTRWGSSILAGRSIRRKNRRIRPVIVGEPRSKLVGPGRRGGGKIPAVEGKVKFLGRLVPGCRKLSLPSLLQEAADYIAALQMQVRAMKSLTEKLSDFAGAPLANRPESDSESPILS